MHLQFVFLSFTTLLATLLSSSAGTVSLTPETAPNFALQNNPALSAARLRVEEARGCLSQSGRVSNPEVSSEFIQNVREPERSVEVALTQRTAIEGPKAHVSHSEQK